jgi:hypothetical protein
LNYPPANVWTKIEIEVESEPELVDVVPTLRLPATWSPERRAEFVLRWRKRQ